MKIESFLGKTLAPLFDYMDSDPNRYIMLKEAVSIRNQQWKHRKDVPVLEIVCLLVMNTMVMPILENRYEKR